MSQEFKIVQNTGNVSNISSAASLQRYILHTHGLSGKGAKANVKNVNA